MFKRYINNGISPYLWAVLSILPFYFILQSSSTAEIIIGISLTILFFIIFRFAFISKGWPVYVWTCLLIAISLTSMFLFTYIYFAFYIAYLIGNIRDRIAFLTLYVIHLVVTTVVINFSIILQEASFLEQLPFIIITCISVILLPFNIYNKKERGQLKKSLRMQTRKSPSL